MIYGNKEAVEKEIQRLENIDEDVLLNELKSIQEKININKNNINKCKSDLLYWSYIAVSEELDAIKEFIQDRLIAIICSYQCKRIDDLIDASDRLRTITKNKNEVIKGLELYKPAQYKQKIELIKSIFE